MGRGAAIPLGSASCCPSTASWGHDGHTRTWFPQAASSPGPSHSKIQAWAERPHRGRIGGVRKRSARRGQSRVWSCGFGRTSDVSVVI